MEEKEIQKIFSRNLTFWLNERNKTQADLYKKMKVSSATASDWCNEKIIPRVDKLVVIADWLNIELSDLLEDKKRNHLADQNHFHLSDLEKEVIRKFRLLSDGERRMFLRSLEITEETQENEKMA